jgi:hypothetical protein
VHGDLPPCAHKSVLGEIIDEASGRYNWAMKVAIRSSFGFRPSKRELSRHSRDTSLLDATVDGHVFVDDDVNTDSTAPHRRLRGDQEEKVQRSQRSQTSRRRKQPRSLAEFASLVERLRVALLGLAEREIPGDPLACFCVHYERGSGVHDEWCEVARMALAEAGDISPAPDAASNIADLPTDVSASNATTNGSARGPVTSAIAR